MDVVRANECLYYKTLTIRLDNIVAIVFQKTISLSGPWQVFAVATILTCGRRNAFASVLIHVRDLQRGEHAKSG